jgi:hypothetical protein
VWIGDDTKLNGIIEFSLSGERLTRRRALPSGGPVTP